MIWAGRRGAPRGPRTPARDAGCRFADLRRDLFDLLRQDKGELKLVIHLLSLKRTRKVPKRRRSKQPDPKAESVSAVRWKELTLEEHAKSLGQCASVIRKWRRGLEEKGVLPPGALRPYDKWMDTTGVQVVRLDVPYMSLWTPSSWFAVAAVQFDNEALVDRRTGKPVRRSIFKRLAREIAGLCRRALSYALAVPRRMGFRTASRRDLAGRGYSTTLSPSDMDGRPRGDTDRPQRGSAGSEPVESRAPPKREQSWVGVHELVRTYGVEG